MTHEKPSPEDQRLPPRPRSELSLDSDSFERIRALEPLYCHLPSDDQRALRDLIAYWNLVSERGATLCCWNELTDYFDPRTVDRFQNNAALCAPLLGYPDDTSALVVIKTGITSRKFWIAAQHILQSLHSNRQYDPIRPVNETLSSEQSEAVEKSFQHRISTIVGGPGTGKTTTTKALIKTAWKSGIKKIALAAPTGKAADRMRAICEELSMAEAIESKTIHRLLGASTYGFRHDEQDPLDLELLIVDEASMIDLELMAALLRATQAVRHIVFLGDDAQLPSVSPGAILRDVSSVLPTSHLTKNFRITSGSGSKLDLVFQNLRDGHAEKAAKSFALRDSLESCEFQGLERLASVRRSELADFAFSLRAKNPVYRMPSEKERLISDLQTLTHKKILSPLRHGNFGSVALSNAMRLDPFRLQAGEPVVAMRNSMRLQIYNGDEGLIVDVENEKMPTGHTKRSFALLRENDVLLIPLSSVGPLLEPSYAITIHKSQGSEYDTPIVLVPPGGKTTRSLLYTALTRARKGVVLVGNQTDVETAIKATYSRNTILSQILLSL